MEMNMGLQFILLLSYEAISIMQVKDSGSLFIEHQMPEYWYDIYNDKYWTACKV